MSLLAAIAILVFWFALAVCVYIYFGYPALLWMLSRIRPRPVAENDSFSMATFIVAAYNEEKNIEAKLRNTFDLAYPPDRIEVIVASNGCTDSTDALVRGFGDSRVILVSLSRPGKVNALNEAVLQAHGEILVFSDADFLLDREALRLMARKFADPEVGGVCGARKAEARRSGDTTGEGEGLYGRWDKWQKIRESEIGSVFAADGLLYCIRRPLYVPVADPAQADDIAISTKVVLQGFRLLFEPAATAWENAEVHADEEWRRKIRVTHHSVRALLNLGTALFSRGFYSVELLSHKLIRHFIPFFLILLLVASIVIAPTSTLYLMALCGQLLIYALAIAGAALRNRAAGRNSILYVPYFFCFVNAAAFLGILSILRGKRVSAWSTRAEQSGASAPEH